MVQDSISTGGHAIIATGTGVALSSPDHTVQWLSLLVQVLVIVIHIFKDKNPQSGDNTN